MRDSQPARSSASLRGSAGRTRMKTARRTGGAKRPLSAADGHDQDPDRSALRPRPHRRERTLFVPVRWWTGIAGLEPGSMERTAPGKWAPGSLGPGG